MPPFALQILRAVLVALVSSLATVIIRSFDNLHDDETPHDSEDE